jgi:hypothetical protein
MTHANRAYPIFNRFLTADSPMVQAIARMMPIGQSLHLQAKRKRAPHARRKRALHAKRKNALQARRERAPHTQIERALQAKRERTIPKLPCPVRKNDASRRLIRQPLNLPARAVLSATETVAPLQPPDSATVSILDHNPKHVPP